MGYKVGLKGQVVIDKKIRDKLGIQPGWQAVQLLVDDHVEITFLPPEHDRSLAGSLAPFVERSLPSSKELREAREAAWSEQIKRKVEPG
jgi:AbrB family looped-hinge helix DNA binding protein